MRAAWIGAGVLLAVAAPAAAGQSDPRDIGELLVTESFGKRAARAYSGTISWTWNTGSAIEAVEVGVTRGEVHCDVTYTTPEGSFSVSGPGLIDISLGLPPDEEAPAGQRKGKWYSFRVACPSAEPNAHPGANWSHSQATYKQPGGEVELDPRTKEARVPEMLRGTWTARSDDGGEHTSMTWKLCKVGCLPPPKP